MSEFEVADLKECIATLKRQLAEARADRDEALTMLKYPYPDTIAAFIRCKRERNALRVTLEQARETLQHIPYHEYSDALRNGDDPNGAWECFREAARWHLEKGLAALDAGKEEPGAGSYRVCVHCGGIIPPGGPCQRCSCRVELTVTQL